MMRKIITVQGLCYLLTGIWPLIHIYSFVWVTGYKTDIWLVKMVALLSCAIGITLLFSGRDQNKSTKVLGISTAVAFALIDIYYITFSPPK
jgi:hypothetical protein